MKKIAQVVLSEHFQFVESFLSYSFDDEKMDLKKGDLVLVPFGQKRPIEGLVFDIVEMSDESYKIKEVLAKRDEYLPQECLDVAEKMSAYYFAPLQTCVRLFLPKKIWSGDFESPVEKFWKLVSIHKIPELKGSKQQTVVNILVEEEAVEHKKLLEKAEISISVLKNLEEKGVITSFEKAQEKAIFHTNKQALKELNDEQNSALEQLKKSPTSLLHGVTGSGKTEVFMHFFQWMFEHQKESQALFLVPEIALTPQMISYCKKVFPEGIEIIHSQVAEGEKCRIWKRVQSGETRLVIGSRSSLFLPWKQLQTIVIDEEHEWTYKSDQTPRYHAKKVAEWFLESQKNAHLILASATPDVCDMYEAKSGKTLYVPLKNRVNGLAMPKVTIVDMREEFLRKNFSPVSGLLHEKIKQSLTDKKQIVLFLNKRGYAKALQCKECGHIESCPHCDIPFTHHVQAGKEKLICHYCFLIHDVPKGCSRCTSLSIHSRGVGTQKLEEEIQNLFPSARIVRADRDSTSKKGEFEAIYNTMKDGEADILLGTQMIAKGLDLSNVALVGVLSADQGLHIPDFRSSEKVFQLLMQVAGRSGRKEKGEVIFQTFMPHHEVVQAASLHSYHKMYEQIIHDREILKYPPFAEVIKLSFVHKDKKLCMQKAEELKNALKKQLLINDHSSLIITSAPSYIPKINDKYYWNVIIRGQNIGSPFQEFLKTHKEVLESWRIDHDPVFLS